ncbi:MAG: hypothetical protein MRZ17_07455 [Acholeplasmataceae bacterium]|nr:hypothetical protein [Acholeplasmataceae bacterium]
MEGTIWAFLPAVVAIVLALITKKVYLSLFVGILAGALLYVGGNLLEALGAMYNVMSEKVGENVPILVFLVVLGIIVILLQKSGGSKAYGDAASKRIKSKKGALSLTALLGCLIFVDDYFNCLTVGSVMKPVTDKYKVSHSKLAWIIDSTAAPVCIIAPISSWAAAVSTEFEGEGLKVFMEAIPFNFYALLTIFMVFLFSFCNFDFGKMKKDEEIAEKENDLNAHETDLPCEEETIRVTNKNPKVSNLLIPIIVLIICCIGGMIYTGYCLDPETNILGKPIYSSNIIEAFSNCNAGMSLAIGSTIALIIIVIYYLIVKAISFNEIMESIPQGFKTMVGAILILVFAWTLSGIMGAKGGYLDAQKFVEESLTSVNLGWLFPSLFFLLACVISFSTGTSWGTFGILIPIAITIIGKDITPLTILTISGTLGGAVFGDHISPISDTTILASTGANCNHINHVKTQSVYAILVASICFITYLIGGLLIDLNVYLLCLILLVIAFSLFMISVLIIKKVQAKHSYTEA